MAEKRIVSTFLDLVRIDSPSGRESKVAEYCAEYLRRLGFDVWFDDSRPRTGSDTGNLFASLAGTADRTLVLSAHMDCVQPCEGVVPLVDETFISSAGDTVLGGDDKAGVAAILEAASRMVETGDARPTLKVVLTVAEEVGLTGAKALDPSSLEGDLCLVLDADGEPGGIVIEAPTHLTFVATFWGKAAHAGVAPEQGCSAIHMASRAISAMRSGRLDERTTANVGTIEGGTATNVVPARTTITGECRSLDSARADEVRGEMTIAMQDAASSGGGRVDVAWTREYEGFSFAEDAPVVRLVAKAAQAVGLTPRTFSTGGGSDGNIFAAAGVVTLVLSCGMQSVHSTDERIAIADLEALADLVTATIRDFAGG